MPVVSVNGACMVTQPGGFVVIGWRPRMVILTRKRMTLRHVHDMVVAP